MKLIKQHWIAVVILFLLFVWFQHRRNNGAIPELATIETQTYYGANTLQRNS